MARGTPKRAFIVVNGELQVDKYGQAAEPAVLVETDSTRAGLQKNSALTVPRVVHKPSPVEIQEDEVKWFCPSNSQGWALRQFKTSNVDRTQVR